MITEIGEFVNIPEEYIGADSDGDGLPDLVEQYGLKPNGDSIDTNPYESDTDGDGIDDNEELGYIIGVLSSNSKIADYVKALNPHSDPTKIDSDDDGLDDDVEVTFGTTLMNADTDYDNLTDGYEVELWYEPTDANPDGDSYNDYEELQNGTSPFAYNMTASEAAEAFARGGVLGDFEIPEDIETLAGQIAFSFVPFAADARDYFANVFVNQDTGAALLNLGGFLIDFIPVAGAAGDAAKAFPKLARFVAKYADDAPKVIDAIIQTSKQFPSADEVLPGLIKVLPVGTLDEIVDAVKSGDKITKADYEKLTKLLKAADKIVNVGTSLKPQKLLDELINSGKKFNFEEIVAITKMPDGKLVWLEIGKETGKKGSCGLRHIEKHASDFANVGITKEELPEFIITVLSEGKQVGIQNTRPIYEAVYKGETKIVAIDVGSNGFIVGANPASLK